METGRNTPGILNEACQSTWIQNNIRDQVRPKASAQNANYYNSRYVLLAWYQLYDQGDLFGLMNADGTQRKAA